MSQRSIFGRLGTSLLTVGMVATFSVIGFAGEVSATGSVAISGTTEIPNQLSAIIASGSGTPSYQWLSCPSSVSQASVSSSTCTPVGTDSSTYVLAATDYTNNISVAVTDTSGTGGASATYYATLVGPVLEPQPTIGTSPTLNTGTTIDAGATVTATTPTLSASGDFNIVNQTGSTTYQWYSCSNQVTTYQSTVPSGCSSITGASSQSYQVSTSLIGSYLTYSETVTNAKGSATLFALSSTSTIYGSAASFTGGTYPTVAMGTGNYTVNLTGLGSWTGAIPSITSYTVKWYRCGSIVNSGTSSAPNCGSAVSTDTASSSSPYATYDLTAADINQYIVATVAANNGILSSAVAASASTPQIGSAAPSVSVVPVVSGSPTLGSTISVSSGQWNGVPAPTFTYGWYACTSGSWGGGSSAGTGLASGLSADGCSSLGAVSGSNALTLATTVYTVTLSGKYIVAQVIATNANSSVSFFPAASIAVAAATAPTAGVVAITTPDVNGTFASRITTAFSGATAPFSLSYQWFTCSSAISSAPSAPSTTDPTSSGQALSGCTAINGATASSYTVATLSASTNLVVEYTANAYGSKSYTYSTSVQLADSTPSGTVSVSGTYALSSPLSATVNFSAIPAPTSISYQWFDCPTSSYVAPGSTNGCVSISGATGSTYTPTSLTEAALNGGSDYVVVFVTVTNMGGAGNTSVSGTASSTGSVLTTAAPAVTVYPSIPATASTTTPLVASPGTWLGAPTPTFSYTWYFCTSAVSSASNSLNSSQCQTTGATGSSFQPTASYVNDYFLVAVTGHNGVGGGTTSDLTVYSASTTLPLVATLAISGLSITGTPVVGATLTSAATVSTGSTYTTGYQWFECTTPTTSGVSVPANCYAISGAIGATFSPTSNQANYYLTVLETVYGSGTSASMVAASTALVTTSVPGSPTSVTAVAGIGQATVSWIAPTSGYSVTSYRVVASNGSTCTSATTSCVVTGLLYGTSYTFTVTATNAYGTSPASVASNAITPSESYPAAPTAVVAVAGSQSATVSWTAAANNGSLITLYVVTASPGGLGCTSTTTSCVVSGLTNGTAYTFTVAARNAVGTGPVSLASAAVTPKFTASNPPTNLTLRRIAHGFVVAWKPGVANGAVVTGYLVSVIGGGQSFSCTTTTSDTCTVRNLVNGVHYSVSVAAQSAGGNASAGFPGLVVAAGPPSAPYIWHSARGRGVIVIYFRAPKFLNGAPVAYYQYLLNGHWTVQAVKGKLFIVLRGLHSGSAYVLRVRAVSVGGASGASNPIRVVAL